MSLNSHLELPQVQVPNRLIIINSLLRCWQALRWLRNFQPFMEPTGSTPWYKQPVTRHQAVSQLNWIHTFIPYLFKIHLNIIFSITIRSQSSVFRFWDKNFVCISSLHSCYIPFPSYPSWFDKPHSTWRRIQILNLIMRNLLSSFDCLFSAIKIFSSELGFKLQTSCALLLFPCVLHAPTSFLIIVSP
jgi:hypothetical protein